MNIYINNEPKQIDTQRTLVQLLADLQLNSSRGMAIAINNQVIPKTTWENYTLSENDKVTIIKATQGG